MKSAQVDIRPTTYRTVDEYRCAVQRLGVSPSVRSVSIDSAVGRVLAEDIVADRALPAFDNSAVDGFAIRAADVADPGLLPVRSRVSARSVAGRQLSTIEVLPGQCVQIMTGSVVPCGADLVIPVERTSGFVESFGSDEVTIFSLDSKSNIRTRASDFEVGDVAVRAGTVVTPAQVGVLAALGRTHVRVESSLTVALLSTGSEIRGVGTELVNGECHDSNAAMIVADLTRCGADVHLEPAVADDVDACRAALTRCADAADVIVTTGGISAGTEEVVRLALAGQEVEFVSVAVRPGKPQACGRFEETPIVCLPGNPVSALISYELFVRPVVVAALRNPQAERTMRTVRAEGETPPASAIPRVMLGVVDGDDATIIRSHSVGALARANCLIVIPPSDGGLGPLGEYPALLLDSVASTRRGTCI
ncbi:molybdopterin molybdenumtransferase MoeA [Rhodococcus sp. SBT000017]|uniref:molybdopterin molybdotransferase MoeA n=1 Tax=Rhodococcus sp. SBT000017 TaxID=1803385 RepID=UPI000EF8A2FA|nr:gephyrin-like molybdotransferase Glp [Rhodococcus sp. SBT000017]RMB76560.1 molybdopterin molybdenumtransferase MoeA [Rhodococcus sp. SBT000017]